MLIHFPAGSGFAAARARGRSEARRRVAVMGRTGMLRRYTTANALGRGGHSARWFLAAGPPVTK